MNSNIEDVQNLDMWIKLRDPQVIIIIIIIIIIVIIIYEVSVSMYMTYVYVYLYFYWYAHLNIYLHAIVLYQHTQYFLFFCFRVVIFCSLSPALNFKVRTHWRVGHALWHDRYRTSRDHWAVGHQHSSWKHCSEHVSREVESYMKWHEVK